MTKILFIGGSLTSGGDIPDKTRVFLSLMDPEGRVVVQQQTFPRATLEQHWNRLEAHRAFWEQRWDAVVLQEQGLRPINEPELMHQFLALWALQIKSSHATPVLFQPWRRREHAADGRAWEAIRSAHFSFAQVLGLQVAPIGDVWSAFQARYPTVELTEQGTNHATRCGAYLAAAVLAATLTGRSPEVVTRSIPEHEFPQIRSFFGTS